MPRALRDLNEPAREQRDGPEIEHEKEGQPARYAEDAPLLLIGCIGLMRGEEGEIRDMEPHRPARPERRMHRHSDITLRAARESTAP